MLNVAPCHDPEYPLQEVTHDATDYYLREGEAPGRWWGAGATAIGLAGEVEASALRDLFAGKNPHTGGYLVSARGSSARSNARQHEADLDVAAVAARLGLSAEGVRARLRSGSLAGEKTPSGHWRVASAAVDAYRTGKPQPTCLGPLPTTADDGTYTLAEAVRLAGVNVSYLKRLVRLEPPEVAVRDDGRLVQFLVGSHDEGGHWRVATDELVRFMAGRAEPNPVPAYDLAMRAPKSVSILHSLGHLVPPEQLAALGVPANLAGEVVAAHHAAVEDALDLIQRHAAWVRGPGGRIQATGLTVAMFDHRSSRTGDPLLHTHAVVLNVATGVDGRRAALDGTALYAWSSTAGHVYQARLRAELLARLGVRFHQPHNGLADIVGVPRELIDEFSERRRQMLSVMEQLGTFGAGAAQAATLATRPPKDDDSHQSPDELAARAAQYDFGPDQLASLVGNGLEPPLSPQHLGEVAAHLAGPEGLTARATLVDLRDAIKGFATEVAGGANGADLERWATTLLHDGQRFVPVLGSPARASDVIRRADGRTVRAGGVSQTYSTPELLAHEAALVAAHDDGLGPRRAGVGVGLAERTAVASALADRPSLSGEQVAMIRHITTSGIGIDVVVGGPGAGKTFALGAAAEAWRSSGYRVVGAALQGGAAEVLAREARLDEQHTLTGLLRRCDHVGAAYLARSVVVVDETGMADTRQLSRLARYTGAAGAKLVLVGDPEQIPEVGAGGAFGHFVAELGDGAVRLRENRRQRHAPDRARLAMIRKGHADAAIESARADGRWQTAPSGDVLRQRLLADWHADPATAGTHKLIIATTLPEVEWLNQGARAILCAEGQLGDDALSIYLTAPDRAVDARELRVGDVVRATRNQWSARVFTGSVGTIVAVDPQRVAVTVALEAGRGPAREVTLGPAFLNERQTTTPAGRLRIEPPGLTHAYASTAHGVQGRTATRAYVLVARAGLHRQAAYVAASRAADETQFYGLAVPDPDELDRLDRDRGAAPPDPEDVAELADAMARDASQTMASVADPLAGAAGQLITRPTAWLWAEYAELAARLGARPPLSESLRQVRTALAGTYGIKMAALECHQLTSAMSRAMAVPGATPNRVVEIMLRRDRETTRELFSAKDPMAVLVWAAGTRAVEVLSHDAPDLGQDQQRLVLLDTALARQRQGRLALAEADTHGPIAGLLGPPPGTSAGLVAWRRAAAAIVDYRDVVGLFDRDHSDADPWMRALGEVPARPSLCSHKEQVRTVVQESRMAIALAELTTLVRPVGARPLAAVEALVQRSLRLLDDELATLRRAIENRSRLATQSKAADKELERAQQVVAEVGGMVGPSLSRNTSRRRTSAGVAAQARSRAEARLTSARENAGVAARRLDAEPRVSPDRVQLLAQAVAVREARLRAAVLTDPPAWLATDLKHRVDDNRLGANRRFELLAAAYGEVAVYADRWDGNGQTIEAVLGARPPSVGARTAWLQVTSRLNIDDIKPGTGVDLSL